jgi:hypothetical protein
MEPTQTGDVGPIACPVEPFQHLCPFSACFACLLDVDLHILDGPAHDASEGGRRLGHRQLVPRDLDLLADVFLWQAEGLRDEDPY